MLIIILCLTSILTFLQNITFCPSFSVWFNRGSRFCPCLCICLGGSWNVSNGLLRRLRLLASICAVKGCMKFSSGFICLILTLGSTVEGWNSSIGVFCSPGKIFLGCFPLPCCRLVVWLSNRRVKISKPIGLLFGH